MGRHLHDETAEFKMPRAGRHSAEGEGEDEGLEPTQRFDPGLGDRRPRPVPGAAPTKKES